MHVPPGWFALFLSLLFVVSSCATTNQNTQAPPEHDEHDEHAGHDHSHGHISALSSVSEDPKDLCEHRVPQDVCVQCHPELAGKFKKVKDWCGPHEVPESQCHQCHPNLSFEPLPELKEGADVRELTREEAIKGLEEHAVEGKITVVDFYALWCVPCRNLHAHLYTLLNQRQDIALRKVQIEDWDDPLAAKYLTTSPTVPFVIVFDKQGEELGTVSGLDIEALSALLAEASES